MDVTLLERLQKLDRRIAGCIPGFLATHEQRLSTVQHMHARRLLTHTPSPARPTTATSTLRRALEIEALKPSNVLLLDDCDGLAVLLAQHSDANFNVTLATADAGVAAWTESEAKRAGVGEHLTILPADSPETATQGFACVVLHAGAPELGASMLLQAVNAVQPDGQLLLRVQAPWEEVLNEQLHLLRWQSAAQAREIDYNIVPGGFVLDGAGDLVRLQCSEKQRQAVIAAFEDGSLAAPALEGGRPILRRHFDLDFDSLSPDKVDASGMQRFMDAVAADHPTAEACRAISHDEERSIGTWYDEDGHGFTAELRAGEMHLLVNLMPHEPTLEWNVQCAAFHCLGDSSTRMRPHLNYTWLQESIVG